MNYETMGADAFVIDNSDKNAILDYLESTYPPPNYPDRNGWKSYYDTFMPWYVDAILHKGYSAYIPGKSYDLLKYMTDSTKTHLGYSTAFLIALYNLSLAGNIDTYVWNPKLYKIVEENKPVGTFENILANFGKGAGEVVESAFTRILTFGAIAAVIYLLGKTVLTKGIKLPSKSV